MDNDAADEAILAAVDDAMAEMFGKSVVGQRVAVLCPLAPKPVLLDVVQVDSLSRMMKVKTVMGDGTEGREWWLSLSAVITVAVIPKEPNLVQPMPSGIILT